MADSNLTDQILREFNEGNASASLTDEGGAQADESQAGDTSAGFDAGQTGQEGASPGGVEDGVKEGGEKSGEKAPPYDQDPKWKAARAAEKRLEDLLEENELTYEELVDELRSGRALREIVGDRDAEKMMADADAMANTRAFWAQKKAEERESEELPEETIARLKRERQELQDRYARDIEDREAIAESQRAIKDFDSTMANLTTADTEFADDNELALLVLGVNNPATEVDPTDRKAVKQTGAQLLTRLKQLLAKRDQAVIDRYVAGKTSITPIKETSATTGSPSIKHEREPLKAGTSLDDANALAKKQAVEILSKLAGA